MDVITLDYDALHHYLSEKAKDEYSLGQDCKEIRHGLDAQRHFASAAILREVIEHIELLASPR